MIAFPLTGFSTKWFVQAANQPTLWQAVKNSLIIAGSASVLSTVLGIFAARASTRYQFPGKAGLMGLIMLPLVLPEIIVAVSLLVVLLGLGINLTIFTVILGHVLICTPFTIAILARPSSRSTARSRRRPTIWARPPSRPSGSSSCRWSCRGSSRRS